MHAPLPEYIEVSFQGCILVPTRVEYLAAVKRGKAFRRAREHRERIKAPEVQEAVERDVLEGLFDADRGQ